MTHVGKLLLECATCLCGEHLDGRRTWTIVIRRKRPPPVWVLCVRNTQRKVGRDKLHAQSLLAAFARLLPASGIEYDASLSMPEQLKIVQKLMEEGDERALKIYDAIGIYLGYTLAHYAEFYEFQYVLLLGRVTTGPGGEHIITRSKEVMASEFPELAERIKFHFPDETEKRHGQAIAAASLPKIS